MIARKNMTFTIGFIIFLQKNKIIYKYQTGKKIFLSLRSYFNIIYNEKR
jgi:hypothetical protein